MLALIGFILIAPYLFVGWIITGLIGVLFDTSKINKYKKMPRTYEEDFARIKKYQKFLEEAKDTPNYNELKRTFEKEINPILDKVTAQKIADCKFKTINRSTIEEILTKTKKPMTIEEISQVLQEKYDLWFPLSELRYSLIKMEIPKKGTFYFL